MQRITTFAVTGCIASFALAAGAVEPKAGTPAAGKPVAPIKSTSSSKGATPKTPSIPAPVAFSLASLENGKVSGAMTEAQVIRAADALEKAINISKGELETTAEFEERRAATLGKPYLGTLSLDDLHAFSVNVRKLEGYLSGIGYRYDADTESVDVYLAPKELRPNNIGGPSVVPTTVEDIRRRMEMAPLDEFLIQSNVDTRRNYKASNAYGATVTVDSTASKSISLGLTRIPSLSSRGIFLDLSKTTPAGVFKLERRSAATELASLRALLVVKLSAPYLSYHFAHVAATRDSPSEIANSYRVFRGELVEAVIYSGDTGKVFVRIPNAP